MESKQEVLAALIKTYEELGWSYTTSVELPAGTIEIGDRVRHHGHQWFEAIAHGTGDVEAIMVRDADAEIIVQYGPGEFVSAGRMVAIADTRVCRVPPHE